MKKRIIVLDPYYIGEVENILNSDQNMSLCELDKLNLHTEKDSGFGDRILYWLAANYISNFCENVQIITQKYYWPELLFLHFPKTINEDISFSYIENSCFKIDEKYILDVFNLKKNPLEENINNYVLSFDKSKIIHILMKDPEFTKSIKLIKFKNNIVNDYFLTNFSDMVTIHLRRGIGPIPTKEFMEEYPNYVGKDLFLKFFKEENDYFRRNDRHIQYKIYPDSMYFKLIEQFIYKNKNQKIYISSDIPLEFCYHYIEKFPNNIVTRNNFLEEFYSFFDFKNLNDNDYNISIKQTLINLFDLFVLCHSKYNICGYSNWTMFSKNYKEKTIIDLSNI